MGRRGRYEEEIGHYFVLSAMDRKESATVVYNTCEIFYSNRYFYLLTLLFGSKHELSQYTLHITKTESLFNIDDKTINYNRYIVDFLFTLSSQC